MEPTSVSMNPHALLSNADRTVVTRLPSKQIRNQSLQIVAPGKQFINWTEQDHADSYHFMQRTQRAWKESGTTDQYMIYGKVGSQPFDWELIPYQKCRTPFGRMFQQLQVLWRIVFGGIAVSENSRTRQFEKYEPLLNLDSAVQGAKMMQDSESESFLTGAEHSQKVKAAPVGNDYGSEGCVSLAPSTAESRLKNSGRLIGPYDIQLTGTALAHNLVLVTSNIKEFSRTPELAVEDWRL
jgi:hypothetical protein